MSLAEFTTLHTGGPAARFAAVTDTSELVAAVRYFDTSGEPLLLLGGGSNMVIADEGYKGTVIHIRTTGRHIEQREDGTVYYTVSAGENWDSVVEYAVAQGVGGLECLSGIPGSAGAALVQNIGAYGVDMSHVVHSVELLDRTTGQVRVEQRDSLGLVYRSSKYKGTDQVVVLQITFLLNAAAKSAPIIYPDLVELLGVTKGDQVAPADARAAVLELRRRKGMVIDPADYDTWSVGSFFTNPQVDEATVDHVRAVTSGLESPNPMPVYPGEGGRLKLSAAWLIEHAGFRKGYPGASGRVALATKHALAITNRGEASTHDVLELAREVRAGVRTTFGIELEPEPLLIGCSV